MPTTIQALDIFLILLPGFACAYIVQQLAIRPKQTELDKVIEALLLSFVIYFCTVPFFGFSFVVGWKEPVALTLGAMALGILYAANINHDWVLTFLRKIHVTERTSRTSIWGDTFQKFGGTVQVGLADGRTVIGWVRYYSDDPADASIFLEEAKWVNQRGKGIPINGPGILLLRDSGIQYVMFLQNENAETDVPTQD